MPVAQLRRSNNHVLASSPLLCLIQTTAIIIPIIQAVAVLKGDSPVTGVITFTQEKEGAPVTVSGDVSHLISKG